jgi:hypothetical protein
MFCQDLKRRTEPLARESASPQRPQRDEGTNPLTPTIRQFDRLIKIWFIGENMVDPCFARPNFFSSGNSSVG